MVFWRITQDDYDNKRRSLKDQQYEVEVRLNDLTKADDEFQFTLSALLSLASKATRFS